MRTIRTEWSDQSVFFGKRRRRQLGKRFVEHYLAERYHQGLGGRLVAPRPNLGKENGEPDLRCRPRAGALLDCHREPA